MKLSRPLSKTFREKSREFSRIGCGKIDFRQQTKVNAIIGKIPKKQQLFSIYTLILNQRALVYKVCQALIYTFTCFKSFRCKRSVKQMNLRRGDDFYLDKGIKKLEKHLDISWLIRRAQTVKIIKNIFFDEDQQLLINFQKAAVITSSSNSSSNGDAEKNEDMWEG